MRIAVAQLGARRHYAVPWLLHELGLLERLFTDSYIGNKRWLEGALQAMPRAWRPGGVDRWLARTEPRLPPEKVTSFELFGLWRTQCEARIQSSRERALFFAERNRLFNERVLRRGLGSADMVWGFNGEALELFQRAKTYGLRCVLEQTIAPRRIMRELLGKELSRWPGWEPGLDVPPMDDPLERREEAEWKLADLIIAGSEFVAEALVHCGVPEARCQVVPYGVDTSRFKPKPPRDRIGDERLRILFAGEVGLRKGAPYLLEALRQLGSRRVEARFAGRVVLEPARLTPYRDVVTFLGPVPRSRMPELYHWADVLVLPSICEGSALVVYEAMASSLPVICTQNTGPVTAAGDCIVVPRADVDIITKKLLYFSLLRGNGTSLQRYSGFSLPMYRERLQCVLSSIH